MLKYYLDKTGKVIKSIIFPSSEFVDTEPRKGSLNPVTSGGVAEAVAEAAGNVAEQTEQDMKDMEEMFLVNLPCAANTLRFEFSKMDYDPTVAGVGGSGTWKKVNAKFHNVWDWTRNNTSWVKVFKDAFKSSDNLVSVIAAGNTSSVLSFDSLFFGDSSIVYVCDIDTSGATNINHIFRATSIKKSPNIDTSNVTFAESAFFGSLIEEVPLLNTAKMTDVDYMFLNCYKVKSGVKALYDQMVAQTAPPESHTQTFQYCGRDTTTGAAELAQIPSNWGGTAPASLNMGAPQNLTEPLSPSVIDGDDSLTK